jgi:hypothetical protein
LSECYYLFISLSNEDERWFSRFVNYSSPPDKINVKPLAYDLPPLLEESLPAGRGDMRG